MGAEDLIGWALEEYIASVAEPHGWAWGGDLIKSVDFIKPDPDGCRLLQVKNRSNLETSSSKKVRAGTKIEKWHRLEAKTGCDNWDKFHDNALQLSEDGFRKRFKEWLASHPQA